MSIEITKNNWSEFCKKFNQANQYRQAKVTVKNKDQREVQLKGDSPFLGIAPAKKGRSVEGFQLFTGQYDPESIAMPIIAIKEPAKILLEKDNQGHDNRLMVESKDGTVASVVLLGKKDPDQYRSFVERVAYAMYERRGYTSGDELADWYTAEKKVREVGQKFVR